MIELLEIPDCQLCGLPQAVCRMTVYGDGRTPAAWWTCPHCDRGCSNPMCEMCGRWRASYREVYRGDTERT